MLCKTLTPASAKHTSAIRRWSGRWREAQRLRVSRVRQQRLELSVPAGYCYRPGWLTATLECSVQDRLLENGIEKDELKWARPVSDMAVGGAGKMAMTYYEWGEIGPSVLEQARQMVDARREESQQPKLPRTIPCERCPGKRFRRAFDLEQHCIKMSVVCASSPPCPAHVSLSAGIGRDVLSFGPPASSHHASRTSCKSRRCKAGA